MIGRCSAFAPLSLPPLSHLLLPLFPASTLASHLSTLLQHVLYRFRLVDEARFRTLLPLAGSSSSSSSPSPTLQIGYGPNPPNPNWPNGAKICVNFVLNHEEGGERSVEDGDTEAETVLHEFGPVGHVSRRDILR